LPSHPLLRYLNSSLLGLLLLSCPASAHKGAVALAVPMDEIAVDGDLSDWPQQMTRYPIAVPFFNPPRNPEDFQGWLQLGYNTAHNALYVAVEVNDESVATDPIASPPWDIRDGCFLIVDAEHAEKGRNIGSYSLRNGESSVSGPEVKQSEFQAAMQTADRTTCYEWRIDIQKKTRGATRLQPGASLGFNVLVGDLDRDSSSTTMAWEIGTANPENIYTPRLGDALLVDSAVGQLRGQVHWEDDDTGARRSLVQIRSLSAPDHWLQIQADEHGNFAVDLQPDQYRVRLLSPGTGERETTVRIKTGATSTVRLTAPAARGTRVPAGRGKGHWQNFDGTDGLVSQSVYALCQDRGGNIWLGTEGGVSKYDGRSFTSYTEHDGLVDNFMTAILQDRHGDIWFATGTWPGARGVSRFDGTTFTGYGPAEGLASNMVNDILEDSEGLLWFATEEGLSRFDGGNFLNFTTENGLPHDAILALHQDPQGYLWLGTKKGVSRFDPRRTDGEAFRNFTIENGLPNDLIKDIIEDRQGNLWFATQGGLSRFDGQTFYNYTTENGLRYNQVQVLFEDHQGYLWIGTGDLYGASLSRFDARHPVGRQFDHFTTEDGLADDLVTAIIEDREGYLWFGTGFLGRGGGASRYAGDQFTTFASFSGEEETAADQLQIGAVIEDRNGHIWFGGDCELIRYDARQDGGGQDGGGQDGGGQDGGESFTIFSKADGLTDYKAGTMLEDQKGNIWLKSTRFDGRHFENFGSREELDAVHSMAQDGNGDIWFTNSSRIIRYNARQDVGQQNVDQSFVPLSARPALTTAAAALGTMADRDGNVWFGSWFGGAFRFDGQAFVNYTAADGLADDAVLSIFQDGDGDIWFGTKTGGVTHYDGETFTTYTTADGLAYNWVHYIIQDRDGRFLFGTLGGGVSLFDGLVFQNLNTDDGLGGNMATHLLQDSRGDIWIAGGSVTRYRPYHTPPPIRLLNVVAERDHGSVSRIDLPATQDYLAFEFQGSSFKTRPGQMAYVYQLEGYDDDWQVTRQERVVYGDLPIGDYLFQVKAVDRDLDYSEQPATVHVAVHPPYRQIAVLCLLLLSLVGLTVATNYGRRRRRERDQAREQLVRELEEELQVAHDLQMGLMPTESPDIEGLDIAGRCLTANHVGGDCFQYFRREGKLLVCLADVTGHAMEAAIPVVMFDGILKSQIELDDPLEQLFGRLNRTLCDTLDSRTFVCVAMAEIDLATRATRLANGGCPYPYHYRAATGDIAELQAEAYPLGVRPDTEYPAVEAQLEPGDRIIFCSDGIVEAENADGQLFGFERTADTILRGCKKGLNAEDLLAQIVDEVKAFSGEVPQGDDQTIVVLQIEA
jgi:serine phosphatase RsbU (regulator of sigma subunit)/ligand-binding sensor domain-containing protein